MRRLLLLAALAACACASKPAYSLLDPAGYQSFVANWSPDDKPFCAVFQSEAEWSTVMKPAPVMGGNRAFGPPADTYDKHSVLLFARVTPGGAGNPLSVKDVRLSGGNVAIDYVYATPPQSTWEAKSYFAVSVPKLSSGARVHFDDGHGGACDAVAS